MTIWQALLLGIIQGVTEFLPISSSGHLKIAEYFLGFDGLSRYLLFDLTCHLGTFFAILLVFKEKIYRMLSQDRRKAFQILIATLPLFPLVFLIKPIEEVFNQPHFLGFGFLITAALLFSSHFWKKGENSAPRLKDPLIIGVVQATAALPGISRSGSTIAAARLLGWPAEMAVNFSFLLALPAILGGVVFETARFFFHHQINLPLIPPIAYFVGFLSAFMTGILSIRLMMRLVINNRLTGFAIYCLLLGLALIVYFGV